ncbi:MAG TPA: hypothetical protein PK573_08730 [Spirochaetota bacterium]|nr:hypothetical protein [Spirochaetota bacterium]HRZ26012.1 hypothetical protein [Spirochaetota bacterium]
MKKLVVIPAILLLAVPFIILTGQDISLSVKNLAVEKTGQAEYAASFSVRYSGLDESMVGGISMPMPLEKFLICGQVVEGLVREDDFLYAGMSLDLNGDGDTADSFQIKKTRGVTYLGDAPVKTILSPYEFNGMSVYDYSGSLDARTTQIPPSGTPLFVYSLDEKNGTICAGTGAGAEKISISLEKNPCVRVEVLKPSQNRNLAPGFSIEGAANRIRFSNEKLFEGYEDSWNAVAWIALPVAAEDKRESSFRIKIKSISPPFAVRVIACVSIENGIALHTGPAIHIQQ